jgi:LPS-assembly protein
LSRDASGRPTIALLCALAPASRRADLRRLRLKLEKQLRLAPRGPSATAPSSSRPTASRASRDKSIVATGNVVMRQRGATIRADRVDYSVDEQIALATGSVRLERCGDSATGPRLRYNLDTTPARWTRPCSSSPRRPSARRLARHGASALLEPEQKSRLLRAEYTSCPVPRDDWFIRVRELEIDGARNVGTAYNTTVFFLGLPILYSPWTLVPARQPAQDRLPRAHLRHLGQERLRDGAALLLEHRREPRRHAHAQALHQARPAARARVPLPRAQLRRPARRRVPAHDRIAERDRYFLGCAHAATLGGWHAAVNAQKVSDDDYFRDLSTKIAATSQTNLPRDAMVVLRRRDLVALGARARLPDAAGSARPPVPIPYQHPAAALGLGVQQNFHGFDWQFFGELSNFRHPTLVNGQRAIVYPSIAFPLRRTWGYVVPKFGYHFTRYNLGENPRAYDGREPSLPISSVDAGSSSTAT